VKGRGRQLTATPSGNYAGAHDAEPMYSHVLCHSLRRASKEDGILEAWEIMKLDMNRSWWSCRHASRPGGESGPGRE